MAGFGEQLAAAAPIFLGIGSQASGRDPAGIARGFALMEAKQERDQRKAAIENMMSGMGIAGPEKAFLSSLPIEMQQAEFLRRMQPKEPVRGVAMGDRLVDPYTGATIANYGPEPLPADLFGDGGYIGYSNQGATRSGPLNTPLVQAFDFLPDMGVSMEVFSGGQPAEGPNRVGSTRHDHGNAADVFFHKDGRRLDWRNEADIPILQEIVAKAKAAGVTGFGAGDGYMQPGSMHVGFGAPAVWGAGGKGANAPEWLRAAYNGATGGAQPPQQAQAMPQVAQLDARINRANDILMTGRGTEAQRARIKFDRDQWVSERDRLRAQNEKDHLAALRARAEAGGLEEGSPEWQQFMLNNGAGGTAFTVSSDGTVSYGTGAAAANVKPPTEMQSRLSLFGGMMSATSPEIDSLENRWNPANLKDNAAGRMGWAGNYMRSEDAQKYETLGLAWAEGALRMSTGAAATEPEIVRVFKTYFAQPGDSAETIALKRTQRKRFEEALSAASGTAAPAVDRGPDVLADTTAEEVSSGSRELAGQIDLPPDLQALFDRYPAPAGR